MYNLTEGIVMGASLLAPFLPETAGKIALQLNTKLRDFDTLDTFGLYPSGTKVTENPGTLFARLDEKEVMKKVGVIVEKQKAEAAAAAARGETGDAKKEGGALKESEQAHKPETQIEDFAKLELRVGEIIACEAVPKSKKLLQIVSGIRGSYSPEEMVGKKVMVLCNLKPAKLAGVLSEGMLLCAEDEDGTLALMTPDENRNISSGSLIS